MKIISVSMDIHINHHQCIFAFIIYECKNGYRNVFESSIYPHTGIS